jgi:GTP cyclohydrolase II
MLEKQDNKINTHIACERAIDELRRQMGIIIQIDAASMMAFYPVEFLSEGLLNDVRRNGKNPLLLLTGTRARSAKLAGQSGDCFAIEAATLSLADMLVYADPLSEKAPAAATNANGNEVCTLSLKLAKYASLLPALIAVEISPDTLPPLMRNWHKLAAQDIRDYIASPLLDVVETAHAKLPTDTIENAQIVSFRSRYSTAVHLALVVGDIVKNDAPLVRIHSSCVTGDILGSLRCDCGDQLKLAMERIAQEGCGILLYLHQEGRGIGITNKLRAYQLQEKGIDTFDANLMLGFEEDERDFAIAGAMLKKLGAPRIRLLTNNPHKIEAIEKHGIRVAERVPLIAASGKHNHAYLDAKAKKSGHLF